MQRCWKLAVALLLVLLAFSTDGIRAQTSPSNPEEARIKIDLDRTIGEVDPLLFGNFAEHLGRMIYGGIYEEGSPLSDERGSFWDQLLATGLISQLKNSLSRRGYISLDPGP